MFEENQKEHKEDKKVFDEIKNEHKEDKKVFEENIIIENEIEKKSEKEIENNNIKFKNVKKQIEDDEEEKLLDKEDKMEFQENVLVDNKEEKKYLEEEKELKLEDLNKEEAIELTYDELFDRFVEYVQCNKIMSISELSSKLNLSEKETMKKLRDLENEGNIIGFQEGDEYFFLTQKEVDLLTNIITKKKKFKPSELEEIFNNIIQEHDIIN